MSKGRSRGRSSGSLERNRLSPAVRLEAARAFLMTAEGATVKQLAEHLGSSLRTAHRILRVLRESGEPIYDEREGKAKVWRIMPSARQRSITLSTAQMTSLYLSRRILSFLEGTGIFEDLEDVYARLELTLRKRDGFSNLDKKLYDINEAPHVYAERIEDLNALITALLEEHRLTVRHGSVSKGRRRFVIDPYTLFVYRKGLYLYGYSHHHEARRTFGLDRFFEIEWNRRDRFEYPSDYDPDRDLQGAFGLQKGPTTRIEVFFTERVRRIVERRRWHPTQKLKSSAGGLIFSAQVEGIDAPELVAWLLGWGANARVLAPDALKDRVVQAMEDALKGYRPGVKARPT